MYRNFRPPENPRSVEELLEALKCDDHWVTRYKAIEEAAFSTDPQIVKYLLKLLVTETEYTQAYVANALGLIGNEQAIEPLIEAFSYKASDHGLRESIKEALVNMGPAALPAVRQALQNSNPDIRYGAIMVLGYAGNEQDLPALQKLEGTDAGQDHFGGKISTAARKAIKRLQDRLQLESARNGAN